MIFSMMFRVPVPNPSPDLTDKVKAALLSQVSEIANQVCDSMLVIGAAVPLKNRDGLGGPGNWRPRQCDRLYRSCHFLRLRLLKGVKR